MNFPEISLPRALFQHPRLLSTAIPLSLGWVAPLLSGPSGSARCPVHWIDEAVSPLLEAYNRILRLAAGGLQVPKRILIVDDSPVIRKTLRELLEQQSGWEVCGEAANGREGIEKAQQLKPDVIVLDLSMPVMNGIEAARELTRLLPSVPLLMCSGFETADLKREALSAGVRTVVSKSESFGDLVRSIQALLESVS
jgi:CheY-like chemotaxis protein